MTPVVFLDNSGKIRCRTRIRTSAGARLFVSILNKRNRRNKTPGIWLFEAELKKPFDKTEQFSSIKPAIEELLVQCEEMGIPITITAAIKRAPEQSTNLFSGSAITSNWPEEFNRFLLAENVQPDLFDKIFTVN